MTRRIDQLLHMLRDVDGVIGGFVWGKSGALLGRDLPDRFEDDVLGEIGQRIARIYEAFHGAGDELDAATLGFAGSKLYLREVDSAFVAVLSRPQVNEPALKMALHVLGRALYAELERQAPPSPSARLPSAAPRSAAAPPPARRPAEPVYALRMRLQRGKRAPD